MSLFADIQRNLEADPRVTCAFNHPPWFDGCIDGQKFVGLVWESPTAPSRTELDHLEWLRERGYRAWVVRSWRGVQSQLLCELANVYLDLS